MVVDVNTLLFGCHLEVFVKCPSLAPFNQARELEVLYMLYHSDCLIVKLSPHVEHLDHGSCLCRTIDVHLQYFLSLNNTQSVKRL